MTRVWVSLICLGVLSAPLAAKDATPLTLSKGARVGVVSLLRAEVTHFHAAKALKDGYLKTELVGWSADAMLLDGLEDRAAQMGLVLVPLAPGDELEHAREACFLDNGFNRSLPKDCVLPFQHLLSTERLEAVIVVAPGLNNSAHASSSRRKELPDYLRGWGYVTGEAASADGKPTLFSMNELLLVAAAPQGPELRAHEWGGNYSLEWTNYTEPADPKNPPPEAYAQLRPLFAAILARQAARLLDQIVVQ